MSYVTDTISLRKVMIEKGYDTITSFSNDCKVNAKTLGLILKGKIQPTSSAMYRIADCLEMSEEQAGNIFFCKQLT